MTKNSMREEGKTSKNNRDALQLAPVKSLKASVAPEESVLLLNVETKAWKDLFHHLKMAS
jgi:hypothetical protein